MQIKFGRNAAWALAEVIFSGFMLFLLFKIVVKFLGVEALGIWSLVLATTSLGRLADLGTAAGLSRFVAIARAKNQPELAMDYAETALITNFFLYLGIALVIWLPAYYGLALATSGEALQRARGLLPYSLVSFTFISLASATTGALVGQQRSDQKSMITIVSVSVQFLTALAFVPKFGLPALAWAQIAQYALVIVVSWALFLKNQFGAWTFHLPVHWRKSVFKELLGFGMKLQAATIISFLCDPLTKFVMSSLGGLDALGLFEMSQRLVQQVRQLVVMPTQILVPGFAHIREQEPEKVEPLYHKAMALGIATGLPLMLAVAAASPLICTLWIGHMAPLFVVFTLILCAAWYANLFAAPAYVLGVASGHVRWNIAGHIITTGGAPLFGFLLGRWYGAPGIAFAYGLMLGLGSLLSMGMNCRTLHIKVLPRLQDFLGLKAQIMSLLARRRV